MVFLFFEGGFLWVPDLRRVAILLFWNTYLVNFPSKKSLNFLGLVIFSGKTNQKESQRKLRLEGVSFGIPLLGVCFEKFHLSKTWDRSSEASEDFFAVLNNGNRGVKKGVSYQILGFLRKKLLVPQFPTTKGLHLFGFFVFFTRENQLPKKLGFAQEA